jgi:hypothetical protein
MAEAPAIEEHSSLRSLHLTGQVKPSPFTELRILPIITTSTTDFVQDFFQPLLLRGVAYDRGVGFFSAGWLRINTVGLAGLVRNGGRAHWATSPIPSQEEWGKLCEKELRRLITWRKENRNFLGMPAGLRYHKKNFQREKNRFPAEFY